MAMAPIVDRDREIVEKVLAGDVRAYGVLVDRHKDRALTFAVRFVGSRPEGEELVQDAFVRAYRSLGAFGGILSSGHGSIGFCTTSA